MEFENESIVHEPQYLADPFDALDSRTAVAHSIADRDIART
jgi:hypothetical protein